jgi:hypothetical protein
MFLFIQPLQGWNLCPHREPWTLPWLLEFKTSGFGVWKDEEMQPAKKVIWFIRTIFVSLYGHCTNRQEKMNTKLTLKLDNDVISRAKKYAQERKTSLSKMIESYLDYVTKPEPDDSDITPLVKSLSGVISLPEDYDYKKDRTEYLVKKYS